MAQFSLPTREITRLHGYTDDNLVEDDPPEVIGQAVVLHNTGKINYKVTTYDTTTNDGVELVERVCHILQSTHVGVYPH